MTHVRWPGFDRSTARQAGIRSALALCLAAACAGDAPSGPTPARGPTRDVDVEADAAPSLLTWLAPLGTRTANVATFDAAAEPTVEVCAWNGVACDGPPVARFATAPADGELPLAVDVTAGRFEATLGLLDRRFTARRTYRVRVLQGDAELGGLLVDLTRGRWALTRGGVLAPLTAAPVLPISFHVAAAPDSDCAITSPDRDADRLPDCYETNTGRYEGATRAGTDPNDPDTDRDGLRDGDEVLGTALGLDLPAMGVSPLRRDVLLEYDWFDDALECGSHSHRPRPAALARVTVAFRDSPVRNPDGSTGINFIHDYGQGGAFTGGNVIADPDGVVAGGVGSPDFVGYKAANFAANRAGYFHYVLLPHRYGTTSASSGQAEINGDDLIVSLYCANTDVNVANTIVHELGHNLSLRHGGFEDQNYKPNYNSVMNYLYQFPGVDTDCTPPGNGLLTYSTGSRPALNETSLDEGQGVCGSPPGPPWDWNGNGVATDVGLALNVNASNGPGLSVLLDYDDWANVNLRAVAPLLRAAGLAEEVVSCDNPAPVADGGGE